MIKDIQPWFMIHGWIYPLPWGPLSCTLKWLSNKDCSCPPINNHYSNGQPPSWYFYWLPWLTKLLLHHPLRCMSIIPVLTVLIQMVLNQSGHSQRGMQLIYHCTKSGEISKCTSQNEMSLLSVHAHKTGTKVIKKIFILNSVEQEILNAYQ